MGKGFLEVFDVRAEEWDTWTPGDEEQGGEPHCEDPNFNVSRKCVKNTSLISYWVNCW